MGGFGVFPQMGEKEQLPGRLVIQPCRAPSRHSSTKTASALPRSRGSFQFGALIRLIMGRLSCVTHTQRPAGC
jgi:hypothetical protein